MDAPQQNQTAGFSAAQLAKANVRAKEIGRSLFESLQDRRPNMLDRRWWDDQIMEWAMRDESLKVQLFRFVDVLPMLKTDAEVTIHLEEYIRQAGEHAPAALRTALRTARRIPFTRVAVARAARLSAMDFARRFISGENTPQVLAAAERERNRHRGFTLDILGEAVISDKESERYFHAYQELISAVSPTVNSWAADPQIDQDQSGAIPRMNLSVKLSALDSRFDAIDPSGVRRRAAPRLRELLRTAREHGAFINIDMESHEKKDLTLQVFKEVLAEKEFRECVDAGIVVQCYLRDSRRDLVALRDWAERRGAPVWVRLVKGAYWDYETVKARAEGWPIPVFLEKHQSDGNFEWATRFVMSNNRWLRPALASHNLRSLAYGIAVAEQLEIPENGYEIQMLYGMADAEKTALVQRGLRLRVYMPYGELIPGMAYLVRRLLENTSNDSFLRAGFVEHASPDTLLTAPPDPGELPPPLPETDIVRAVNMPSNTFRNEPLVDFSAASSREAMHAALAEVGQRLGGKYPLIIDGRRQSTTQWSASINPSDQESVVGQVAMAEVEHVEQAVAAAKKAFPDWSRAPAAQRAKFLRAAAAVMRDRKFELAAWQIFECGKAWREAIADVSEAIDFCEYYAMQAETLLAVRGCDVPGEENRFVYAPRGVTAVIAPWNFPLAILTGMTTAALATGNTVVMKPANQASVTAALLMEIFSGVGLPSGVLHYLPGPGKNIGAALVEHPDVAMLAFTGSRQVGLQINARAAAVSVENGAGSVKHVIAEMGGKNAIIIDADADLDEAVAGVVHSAFGYQGQKCSACSRVIVLESVHDVFLKRLVEAARSLQVGPAIDPASRIGPLIDAAALAKVRQYIEIGRTEGREVLAVDAAEWAEQGFFVGPHIFADVLPHAKICQEEIFGPVLAVIRAADLDEAFVIANQTDYALTGAIYSRSPTSLERARRELEVGNLYLNRGSTGALVGRQPFGGFKMSGMGSKAGGADYLLQFVVPRTITENTLRRGFAPPAE